MSAILAVYVVAALALALQVGGGDETIPLDVAGEIEPKRFVLRVPEEPGLWNGALVVAAHGGRGGESYSRDGRVTATDETSLDDVIGAHALSRGFAYASFDRDGIGGTLLGLEVTKQFTREMKALVGERLGLPVERTYLVGLSMGGGIARYAAEEAPSAYDGVLIIVGAGGDAVSARERSKAMARVWPRRGELGDAAYAAAVGTPVEAARFWPFRGESAAASAPAGEEESAPPETTGRVSVPTLEVAGTFDDFVYPEIVRYAEKVRAAGAAERHRLYAVAGAWHISPDDDAVASFQYLGSRLGLADDVVDQMATGASYLPAVREALGLLDGWVRYGVAPPPGRILAEGEPIVP